MAMPLEDLQSQSTPIMLRLAQPMATDESAPSLGAMTKYKTFNGEEINGEKVWHYDHHDDD